MRRNFQDEDGTLQITPVANRVLMSTHDKLMSYLPRIMTSGGSATDTYDPQSTLSKFLEGFSFTLDELLTYTDLIVPGISGKYSNPGIVDLQSLQLGLSLDTDGLTRTQKQLVRNAIYLYSRKGTTNGIEGWAKAMTGYKSAATVGSNLLLSLQDSDFINGKGFWQGVDGAVITADNTQSTSSLTATGDYVVDNLWSAKVVATTPGSGATPTLRLGMDDPIRTGIPVVGGQTYTLSYAVKSASSGAQISYVYIKWFDATGALLADSQTAATVTVTSSFVKKTYTQTAPSTAVYAAIRIGFVGTSGKTYYLARVQLALSSVTNYSPSRAVFLTLSPKRVNYIKNPSFVSGGASWTYNNATQTFPTTTLVTAPNGTTMLQLVTTASGTLSSPYVYFDTTAGLFNTGQFYTFSIYGKASATKTVDFDLYAVDSSNGSLSLEKKQSFIFTTNWQRFSVTLYLPTTFAKATTNLLVKIYGTSVGSGVTLQLDQAQLEDGYAATNYFDGSIPNIGAGWTSGNANANNSTSYLYPNRVTKLLRLNNEIANYLPINRPYFVISNLGVEKFGITS
jgi:hypothetical protein